MDYNEQNKNLLLEKDNNLKNIVIIKQENINNAKTQPVLSVLDTLLSICVVTPFVVFSWRGLWSFMDMYPKYFPAIPIFFAGMGIHVGLALCQDALHNVIIESEKHWSLKLGSHFLRRCYTYTFLIVTILHWRGGWLVLDSFTGVTYAENGLMRKEGSQWLLLVSGGCFLILVFMKGLRNATAPPYSICLDKGNYVFKFPTMFKQNVNGNKFLYLLDCLFSVGVVGNLVIFYWKGLWSLADIIIMPNDFVSSSWASLIIGLLLVGFTFRLQTCMKNLCAKLSGFSKLILADFYIVLSIISTVLYWRGVWNLLVIYFLPNNDELSCLLSHLLGVIVLLVLGCSNSMLVRGVYKDGKEPNGECVVFPCQFLQIILEQENPSNTEINENI